MLNVNTLRAALTGIALAMIAASASAQSERATSPEDITLRTGAPQNSIVVTGNRELEKKAVRDALRGIAMRGRHKPQTPLAKYHEPICVKVLGLGRRYGDRVAKRVSLNAERIGFEAGAPGCKPNANIIVVDDPKRMIKKMREKRMALFNIRTLNRIKALLNDGYPAISWSVTQIRDERGDRLLNDIGVGGPAPVGTGIDDQPQTRSWLPSRTRLATTKSVNSSVVVFDALQLNNVHLDQLADYATMRILADTQIPVAVSPAETDTILHLFELGPDEAAPGLTMIDLAYLRGLYSLKINEEASRLERSVIAAYENLRSDDCLREIGPDCDAAKASSPDDNG